MEDSIGGSARSRYACNRVVESAARDDIARTNILPHRVHDHLAAMPRRIVFAIVDLRNRVDVARGQTDDFHNRRHGVRRILPAAGARPGTRRILNSKKFVIADAARRIGPDGFEDILDNYVFTLVFSRQHGPAIEDCAGDVQAQQRHGSSGYGLVAGNERDDAVEHVPSGYQFDRIGNHFPADKRSLHALGAHRDPIADGNGVELHGRSAGFTNSARHVDGQLAQVVVARHRADPCVCDSDDGLFQVFVGKTDGLQVRARRCPVFALRDGVALELHRNFY